MFDGPAGAPLVEPGDAVILGHRPASLDSDVALELDRVPAAIARMGAPEIAEAGPAVVGSRWASKIADRGPTWLHLDLDALDEAALHAVTYAQPRGLDWDAFGALTRPLLASHALPRAGRGIDEDNGALDRRHSGSESRAGNAFSVGAGRFELPTS